jgi:predicted NBD/HSP70 family sugar kinase
MIVHFLPEHPEHPLRYDTRTHKENVLSLRDLAQHADPLALRVFDTQAAALGLTVAAGCMAYDPSHVIIGGGLIDPGATSKEFRERYLEGIQRSAARYLWVDSSAITYSTA